MGVVETGQREGENTDKLKRATVISRALLRSSKTYKRLRGKMCREGVAMEQNTRLTPEAFAYIYVECTQDINRNFLPTDGIGSLRQIYRTSKTNPELSYSNKEWMRTCGEMQGRKCLMAAIIGNYVYC